MGRPDAVCGSKDPSLSVEFQVHFGCEASPLLPAPSLSLSPSRADAVRILGEAKKEVVCLTACGKAWEAARAQRSLAREAGLLRRSWH